MLLAVEPLLHNFISNHFIKLSIQLGIIYYKHSTDILLHYKSSLI